MTNVIVAFRNLAKAPKKKDRRGAFQRRRAIFGKKGNNFMAGNTAWAFLFETKFRSGQRKEKSQ
jgi:hypothetical protein